MRTGKWVLLLVLIGFISTFCSSVPGETLSEEQMTEYRTRPAVVLIYSGMFVKIALKSGDVFPIYRYGAGSGFFINPDGYLVTNGGVVDIYMKYMDDKEGYVQQVFDNFVMQRNISEFEQARGREPSQQEIDAEYRRFMASQEPEIVEHNAINYVVLSNSDYFPFEVKKFSPPIPDGGKDIAVLKIQRRNCPVIMLGDSSQLTPQQAVFTIGFSAVVDPRSFPLLDRKNTLGSSVTRGSISALKTGYEGISVIRYDSAASSGNSGGPTVDIKGRVIGVHSYATGEYGGFKFCVPINSVQEFIRDTGIETDKLSEFSSPYNQLLEAVREERWFEAETHGNNARGYMKNEPDLEKLQQMVLKRINEMGFFEKIWRRNKFIVILAVVLIVLILAVLKIAFTPTASEQEAPVPREGAPAEMVPEKAAAPAVEDTGLEGEIEIVGTVTVVVRGEDKGTFNIASEGVIVGRDPSTVNVQISDILVSKNHLRILPKGDQFYLVDLGSTNGTYVNGEKITESRVSPDDMVQLGQKGDIKLILKK